MAWNLRVYKLHPKQLIIHEFQECLNLVYAHFQGYLLHFRLGYHTKSEGVWSIGDPASGLSQASPRAADLRTLSVRDVLDSKRP